MVVALVFRRSDAWLLLLVFDGVVVVSNVWDWKGFVVNGVALVLLISPPMLRHVGKFAYAEPASRMSS
jgi:hypothetical protein